MRNFLLTVLIIVSVIAISCGSKKSASENVLNIGVLPTGENIAVQLPPLWVNRGEIYKRVMFRSLFMPDKTLVNVKPDLASAYEISEDGLTYKITIKDGVTWHDGEKFSAEDVVWSIGAALKSARVSGIYTGAFSKIAGVDAFKKGTAKEISGLSIDGNVITMKVTVPVGNMIAVLGQFAIYPKHLLEKVDPLKIDTDPFWTKPVGNGMYKLSKFEPGNYAEFVPYENYDGPKPKIAKIILTQVPDAISAVQAKQMDYYNSNVTDEINEISKLDFIQTVPIDILFYRYFILNIKDENGKPNKKLEDKRVREALLYAIDRDSLTKSLFPNMSVVNNTGVAESSSDYWKDAQKYKYDPELAKKMLTEAGFDFNQTIKLRYYYNDQASANFILAIAQYWQNIGLKVDAQKFQGDATAEIYNVRDHDVVLKGLSAFGYEEWYGEYGSFNNNFVKIYGRDGYFDEKANLLAATTDPAKRKEILIDLQKLEQEYMYKIPLFMLQNFVFVNKEKVKFDASLLGNPWFNHDIKFEEWEIK